MKVSTNPDKKLVAQIRAKLAENDNYCPCCIKKTPDTKCMCKEFRDMLASGQSGECRCGLYIFDAND